MTQVLIYIIVSAIIIGLMGWYYHRQRKKLEREKSILMLQQNALREQYEQLEEAIKISRQYQKEIESLMEQGIVDAEDAGDFSEFGGMQENISDLDVDKICKNPLIQKVFQHKALECSRKKIRLVMDITGIDELKIKDIDLTGILYNLFDNAIEACMRIVTSEDRYISVATDCRKKTWHLKVENSCLNETNIESRRTWKSDPEDHGIGLTIMRDLVRENRGRVSTEQEGSKYITEIWLPLK